jgi:hypothetical protein
MVEQVISTASTWQARLDRGISVRSCFQGDSRLDMKLICTASFPALMGLTPAGTRPKKLAHNVIRMTVQQSQPSLEARITDPGLDRYGPHQ